LFQIAVDQRSIQLSPAANLPWVRPDVPIRLTPSWEDFLRIVEAVRSNRLTDHSGDSADLLEFMGKAGIGMAEAAGLLGQHVDLEKKTIVLMRRKTRSAFTIPVFPQVEHLLQRLHEQGRLVHGQPVFRIRDPKKALAAACKRLGSPAYSTRALRRCFITRAVELGVDFKTISAWQGHRDGGALIARVYSHLRSEHSDRMARLLI
jgi:integrase